MSKSRGSASTIGWKAKRLPRSCVYPSACTTPTYRTDRRDRALVEPAVAQCGRERAARPSEPAIGIAQVGTCLRYTGRAPNAAGKEAHDPPSHLSGILLRFAQGEAKK